MVLSDDEKNDQAALTIPDLIEMASLTVNLTRF